METALKENLNKKIENLQESRLNRRHLENRQKARSMGEDSFSYRFLDLMEVCQDPDFEYRHELLVFEDLKNYAIRTNQYDKIKKPLEEGISTLRKFRTSLSDYCLEKLIKAETSMVN